MFTPNVLTILGVIMYLRLGWVVGNAGFVGAVIIIVLAKAITVCTGLSMSSIATNTRIGPGGAYSIISRSLGLEAGGSTGVPLYVAQTLSAALYIIGFTEGWLRIFPSHTPNVVSSVAWVLMITVAYVGAKWAIRVQYFIMAIMALSILAFLFTPAPSLAEPVITGSYAEGDFWVTFAIFFPAVTGIMAGANMSGDLKDPARSIPLGTLGAIGVTLVIYIALAWVAASVGTAEELRSNQMFMVDNALWGPIVIAGIMGATLSSALGSIVGAPRILQALAEQKTVPFHRLISRKATNNEPRIALLVTAILIEVCLLLGSLNALAILITMFFLVTYGMLNMVVFIEQSMKIISFRPTFKVPRFVPFLGALGCLCVMFLINPAFSIIAMFVVVVLYVWLARKGLESQWGDVRSGLFLALAGRAAKMASRFPQHQKSWKPDLVLPVDDPKTWAGPMLLIRNIIYPSGSLFAFTPTEEEDEAAAKEALDGLVQPLGEQGFLVQSTTLSEGDLLHCSRMVIQIQAASVFKPNLLFLPADSDGFPDDVLNPMVDEATEHGMGILLLSQHPRMAFGMQKDINLWLRDKSPNWHLALLVALHLQLNWKGKINLLTATPHASDRKRLAEFLENLCVEARLPPQTEIHILEAAFKDAISRAPRADLTIFGLAKDGALPLEFIRAAPEKANSSCIFVREIGYENVLV